ncbi:uncharacterized protein CXorf65 homolog isoform X2 [Triplophysa rosa]|uniref:uncharacterized protein CXorf65 homolog isoform X2 n=1 Tax=Triplophysa rosa TaxID=992332 RepID=UPI002546214B|nr:uncharacterized protein CXorf65 homolog isoform X2 [Triplophysa rosa]
MFVIVMLDEGREQLLNLNCWIINFVYCLKAKCGLDLEESVDLMDRDGKLMNLTERAQSTDLVSSVLKERETYIPVRVSRAEGPKYSAIFEYGTCHPELAEVLRKLLNPSKERDKRGGASKKGGVSQSRIKAAVRKSIAIPRS